MRGVLESNLYYPSDIELNMLYERFDTNKNGKIYFSEFLDQLMPNNSLRT